MPYFPPGPSNIKHLELIYIYGDIYGEYDNELREKVKSYSTNFSTHSNIKIINLAFTTTSPYDFKDLKLEKMIQLEDLELRRFLNINDIELILKLPTLKKLEFFIEFDEINSIKNWIEKSNLKFPNIEEIIMYVYPNKKNFNEIKREIEGVLKKNCKNIKKFEIYNK